MKPELPGWMKRALKLAYDVGYEDGVAAEKQAADRLAHLEDVMSDAGYTFNGKGELVRREIAKRRVNA